MTCGVISTLRSWLDKMHIKTAPTINEGGQRRRNMGMRGEGTGEGDEGKYGYLRKSFWVDFLRVVRRGKWDLAEIGGIQGPSVQPWTVTVTKA